MQDSTIEVGFIGGGNMATAMIRGLLRAGLPARCIHVADPQPEQRRRLAALDGGLVIHAENRPVAEAAGILVLAVKPQLLATVTRDLAGVSRPPGQLIVSVAAGISLDALASCFGSAAPVVRIMPNQPAIVGAGMSVLVASATAGPADRQHAFRLAAAMGEAVWIEDESLMDAVTAVSGSGPAYFYLLMEILAEGAAGLGLPADLARKLAIATAAGAGRAAATLEQSPAELRASVTSPGGTTAAALAVLEEAGLRGIFGAALQAARDRSVALGGATTPDR